MPFGDRNASGALLALSSDFGAVSLCLGHSSLHGRSLLWSKTRNFLWLGVDLGVIKKTTMAMNEEKLRQLERLLQPELAAIAAQGVQNKERRTEYICVYLTPSEKAKLEERCAGIGTSKFMRSLLLRSRPLVRRPPIPQVNRDIYTELLRIGRNLNQQTRALHEALQQSQSLADRDAIRESIAQNYQSQLEALALLLHQTREALLPLEYDEEDEEDGAYETDEI